MNGSRLPLVTRGARIVRVAALTVVALGATACGISADGAPRDIESDQQQSLVETRSANTPRPGTAAEIYLVSPSEQGRSAKLRAVGRDVNADPESVLTALLDGLTPEEQDERLRTAIPAGTRLNSAEYVDSNTLVVDVSSEFFGASGEVLTDAVAQIVFSAYGLDKDVAVRLSVDGEQREWPTGDGSLVSRDLTVFDYPELNPTSQPDYPSLPSPQAKAISSEDDEGDDGGGGGGPGARPAALAG